MRENCSSDVAQGERAVRNKAWKKKKPGLPPRMKEKARNLKENRINRGGAQA